MLLFGPGSAWAANPSILTLPPINVRVYTANNNSCSTLVGTALVPGAPQNHDQHSPGMIGAPTFNSGNLVPSVWGLGWTSDNDQTLTLDADRNLTWTGGDGNFLLYFNTALSSAAAPAYAAPVNAYSSMTVVAVSTDAFLPTAVNVRDTDGTTRLFQVFESTRVLRLALLTDRNGNTVTYARDGQGRLTTVTDVHGRYFALTYSGGFVSQLADSGGRTTTYAYDGSGRRTSETGPFGTTAYAYDSSNRMTQITYPNGGVHNYSYDGQGRVSAEDDGSGQNATSYVYGSTSTTITDALGRATVYEFVTVQGLKKTSKITDPAGGITTFTYDANLNLASRTDPNGHTTHYTYDARGNVTATQDAANGTTATSYEPVFNQPTQTTDPLGHATVMSYDGHGNLTRITDPLSHQTNMSYDTQGHVSQETDPLSHSTNYTYQSNNGALASIEDPLGETTLMTTDGLSHVTQNTDPTNKVTGYTYDTAGNITQTTDALGHHTSYAYDPGRNQKLLKTVTDANGHTTTFGYDDLGRQTSVKNALNQTKYSQYDANGNLTQTTNARGQVITYTYDTKNRLTRKTLPEGQINYTYDAAGNVTQITHYNGSSIQNSYDSLNRLIQQVQTLPNGYAATIGYAYDAAGNRTGMSTPWGNFGYQYDSANRLTQITNPQNKTFAFFYDAAGRRTGLSYPNGIFTAYTYDNANRVTSIIATRNSDSVIISSVAYTYDASGNRTSMTDWEGTHTYGYDDLHRLTSASHPANTILPVQNETFSYDSVGNRLADAQIGGYTYDVANRLTQNSSFTYTYDADGNQTQKTDTANVQTGFTFDSQNEMTGATVPNGDNWTYNYDANGRRVDKSSGSAQGQVVRYIYDGPNIIATLGTGNSPIQIFTNSLNLDEPLLLHSANGDYAYHLDALMSVRSLTNMSGAAIESYRYLSGGSPQILDASGDTQTASSAGNIFFLASRELDAETGIYNNRRRYYDPLTGRFEQEDPVGIPGGLNLFAYAGNNPILYVDPFGLTWEQVLTYTLNWAIGNQIPSDFGPGTNEVNDLRNARGVNMALAAFYKKNYGKSRCEWQPLTRYDVSFGLSGLWNAGTNSTQQFIGTYRVDIIPNPDGSLNINVTNTTSVTSLLYGEGPSWNGGPGGNQTQIYHWTQP